MQILGTDRSLLELGALTALVTFAVAGLVGAIAVIDTDLAVSGLGVGFGITFLVFLAGATVVCALACLARARAELVALAGIAVTGLALDLLVLAIWLEIESEWYGKLVGIGLAWSFFALLAFGLLLAVSAPGRIARWPFYGALGSTAVAGLLATYLIATAGDTTPSGISVTGAPVPDVGDDELLRILGLALVLLGTFWFAAIAAHRYERGTV